LRELLGSLSITSLEDGSEDGVQEEVYNTVAVNESTPHKQIEKHENLEIMKKIFSTLSDRETLVLSLYYLRGLNLKEIAKIMSLCESRISQHHRQAITKLKEKLDCGQSVEDVKVEKLFNVLLSA
jgi:RNA polymerase sigma factor for flagellar operon FliA